MTLGFDDYLAAHGAALQRYAFVLTGNAADAEDLVQTALVRAYRRWRRIGKMAAPHAYVRRIVTGCFIDQRRRRNSTEQPMDAVPDAADPTDHTERVADLDAIIRALDHLTAQQRAVLTLRHLLGLPDGEIARDLGCSVSTVRSHASRGLHRLRELLSYPDLEIDHEPRP
jgi:RNA polymerase sigma-70 factor (sigma-E family)